MSCLEQKKDFVLKGNVVHAPHRGSLEIIENGFLVVRGGKLEEIAQRYEGDIPVVDYKNSIIIPGLCDMHIHAPQFAMRGLGLHMELLPWLNTYTFPEESKFAQEEYARQVYTRFAQQLVRNGTTRACVFGTIHTHTVLLLMDILEQAGICAYVGKVNMDRHAPVDLCEQTQQSVEETLNWIHQTNKKSKRIQPIITPRFLPACSQELLYALGDISKKQCIPVQSHLSENLKEIEWVKNLEPDCHFYAQAYQKYGLFGESAKTVMAHCVHSPPEEMELMANNGVYAAHCPDSNANLASGMANVKLLMEMGVSVVLGSDVAAGCTLSILDQMAKAIQISKLRSQQHGGNPLTFEEAFYLGTSAGAAFFEEGAGFQAGSYLHAVVLNDAPSAYTAQRTVAERMQKMVYLPEERVIQAVYANGGQIL